MPAEIPGFYYDEEKKKYFKIQANHAAPAGSQYTVDSVKRKREDKENKRKKANFEQKVAKEKIRPSRSLHHPLSSINQVIGTRLSSGVDCRETIARTYVNKMDLAVLHRFESFDTAVVALREPNYGALVLGSNAGLWGMVSICWPDLEDGKWTYNRTGERSLAEYDHGLSSMSLDRHGILLSTFDTGQDGRSFLMPHSLNPHLPSPPVILNLPRYKCTTASAACPSGDKALFAVGTTDGLFTLESSDSRWELTQKSFPRGKKETQRGVHGSRAMGIHSMVHSVDWMSSTVIASGMRDSAILLYDIRSNDSVTRLQHARGVDTIRRVDEHRLVVAGDDCLQMYDLRFAPNGIQRNPQPAAGTHTSTRPYLAFRGYKPHPIPSMDVSPELNVLVATTQESGFRFWSLRTGADIPTPPGASEWYERCLSPICVGFETSGDVPNQYGTQTPSLLVGSSNYVDQWIW
ncbi:hypothetical protein N7512_005846 [Penicillium capsulatum]|nr:hypothetical protein N7512_005846 [Penicillium capsulatum]